MKEKSLIRDASSIITVKNPDILVFYLLQLFHLVFRVLEQRVIINILILPLPKTVSDRIPFRQEKSMKAVRRLLVFTDIIEFRTCLNKIAASDFSGPILKHFFPFHTFKKIVNTFGGIPY